jgi:hypothetical protein
MATRPTMALAGHDRAMAQAAMRVRTGRLSVDEVGHFDLYSCFASSLAFACDALGLGPSAA